MVNIRPDKVRHDKRDGTSEVDQQHRVVVTLGTGVLGLAMHRKIRYRQIYFERCREERKTGGSCGKG